MEQAIQICHENHVSVPNVLISNLLILSIDSRLVYSQHFKIGKGLQRDGRALTTVEFVDMVPDPQGLKPMLQNLRGASYSNLEIAFLICATFVCRSRVGGSSLFSLISGRPRDGVTLRSKKLNLPASLQH